MIIYAGKDYQDVSRKAANIMSAQIIMKPDAVLGLATGSTPVGMYAQLVEWYKKGDLDFSRVTSVNLDEGGRSAPVCGAYPARLSVLPPGSCRAKSFRPA